MFTLRQYSPLLCHSLSTNQHNIQPHLTQPSRLSVYTLYKKQNADKQDFIMCNNTIWLAAQEECSFKYLPICVEEVQCQLHVNGTLHSAEVFVWLQGQCSIGLWGYTVFCKEEHEIKRKWQVQWFGQPQKKYSTSVNFNCKSTWQRLNTSLFINSVYIMYI